MENISTITSLSVDLGFFGGDICMPVCPKCGAYSRVGDNYGDTCTNYGYNLEYGEFGRHNRNITTMYLCHMTKTAVAQEEDKKKEKSNF
jgi:hypothetical protein